MPIDACSVSCFLEVHYLILSKFYTNLVMIIRYSYLKYLLILNILPSISLKTRLKFSIKRQLIEEWVSLITNPEDSKKIQQHQDIIYHLPQAVEVNSLRKMVSCSDVRIPLETDLPRQFRLSGRACKINSSELASSVEWTSQPQWPISVQWARCCRFWAIKLNFNHETPITAISFLGCVMALQQRCCHYQSYRKLGWLGWEGNSIC